MLRTEWIKEKYNKLKGDRKALNSLYTSYNKTFNDNISYSSYKRKIRKVLSKMKNRQDKHVDQGQIQGNRLSKKQEANTIELTYKTKRIISLDDLIREAKIDLSIWRVDRHEVNKWEVGRSNKQQHITYDNGVRNGNVDDYGDFNVEPLIQVKVWLSKRKPDEQLFPVIKPVNIVLPAPQENIVRESNRTFKKALIIPDAQIGYCRNFKTNKLNPFHDRRCFDIALQLLKEYQFDDIILLGDMLDMAEWSDKFTVKPEFYQTTQPSIYELSWWLAQMRYINQNANMIYLEGNHEERLPRAIFNNMIASYHLNSLEHKDKEGVMTVPYLLGLEKLNIEYKGNYPKNEFWLNDNLRISHGDVVRQGSSKTVEAILRDCRASEIIGHIHRIEQASKAVHVRNKEVIYTVCSPGTFCKIDGTVPSKKGNVNWQQGFAVVDYEDGNGRFQINPYVIYNGKCIYNGKLYEGKPNVNQISKDIGWSL